MAGRQQLERARKQVLGCPGIPPGGSPLAGCQQVPGCALGDRAVGRQAELPPVAERLLEVPAGDLVQLDQLLSVDLQPAGEGGVQLRPLTFGQCVVGGVADQQVAEPVRLVAVEQRVVGSDQLLAHERGQVGVHTLAQAGRRQFADSAAVEHLALNRPPFDHRPLRLGQPLQARCQQRLDGWRHVRTAALMDQRGHLLQKQRVALAGLHHPRPGLGIEAAGDTVHHRQGVAGGQRLEQRRGGVELPAGPPTGPQATPDGRWSPLTPRGEGLGTRSAFPFRLERLDLLPASTAPPDERGASPRRQRLARATAACSSRPATLTASPVASVPAVPHNLAGIDADAAWSTQLGERVAHLRRRPHGSQRVVLVHQGNAEDGHHRVADELLHRSPVRLHDRFHTLEVARQLGAQRLRISRLAERSRTCDIAEDDCHGLPLLPRHATRIQRRRAGITKARARRVLLPATRADQHKPRLEHQPQSG